MKCFADIVVKGGSRTTERELKLPWLLLGKPNGVNLLVFLEVTKEV
jgi:hypothetical protein